MTSTVDGARNVVACTTAAGVIHAIWKGTDPPRPGPYEAELDLPGPATWGTNMWLRDEAPAPALGRVQHLAGTVEDIGQDGVICIRVGDGILLVEVEGDGPVELLGEENNLLADRNMAAFQRVQDRRDLALVSCSSMWSLKRTTLPVLQRFLSGGEQH